MERALLKAQEGWYLDGGAIHSDHETVLEAVKVAEDTCNLGQTIEVWSTGWQVAEVSRDDAGTVATMYCCQRAKRGDWDERAGGALHCPWCGSKVARFRQ